MRCHVVKEQSWKVMEKFLGKKCRNDAWRKTWWDGVRESMKRFGLSWEDEQDQNKWRKKVNRFTGWRRSHGTDLLNIVYCSTWSLNVTATELLNTFNANYNFLFEQYSVNKSIKHFNMWLIYLLTYWLNDLVVVMSGQPWGHVNHWQLWIHLGGWCWLHALTIINCFIRS